MNTVLIMLICGASRCDYEPQYAVVFPTEQACRVEAAKYANPNHSIYLPKVVCVPEVKMKGTK